jgi:lipopolysaccharide export system permease protein
MFNDIADINIKVDKKYGENDRFLDKVIIHQKSNDKKNRIVIKSKNGELKSSPDSDILQMVLFDGNRYEDVKSSDPRDAMRRQHAKVSFEKYIMNVDLRDINKVDLEDEKYNTYKMFKVRQLNDTIKSFERKYDQEKIGFGNNMYKRTGIVIIDKDTTNQVPLDSLSFDENILDLMTLKNQKRALDISITNIKGRRTTLENTENRFKRMEKKINHQKIYLHDKFAVAIACIILFFVGAPLGAIIRKGGIGLPMVVAICLFLVYHFIGIFGKNSAEDGSIPPWLGTWLSTMIMFPLSIYFTRRATSDLGLFSFSFKGLFVKPIEDEDDAPAELAEISETDRQSTDKFTALSDTQLMDVVKNYRQYNYSEGERSLAIGMLEERGISQRRLKVLGVFVNKKYNRAQEAYKRFNKNAKRTFIYYIPTLIIGVLLPVLNNNIELSYWTVVGLLVALIVSTLVYLYYFIKSIFNYSSLHEALNEKLNGVSVLAILLVGIPLYFLIYLYTLRNAKEKMKQLS